MRILFVSGDVQFLQMAERALRHHFPVVDLHQAYNSDEAANLLAVDRTSDCGGFDCLIVDEDVLKEDHELRQIQFLRAKWPCVPMVVVTQSVCPEFTERFFEAGVDDYVVKSVTPQLLGHSVWSAIARRRGRLQIEKETRSRWNELENIRTRLQQD